MGSGRLSKIFSLPGNHMWQLTGTSCPRQCCHWFTASSGGPGPQNIKFIFFDFYAFPTVKTISMSQVKPRKLVLKTCINKVTKLFIKYAWYASIAMFTCNQIIDYHWWLDKTEKPSCKCLNRTGLHFSKAL